jgi:hypothetical protein
MGPTWQLAREMQSRLVNFNFGQVRHRTGMLSWVAYGFEPVLPALKGRATGFSSVLDVAHRCAFPQLVKPFGAVCVLGVSRRFSSPRVQEVS